MGVAPATMCAAAASAVSLEATLSLEWLAIAAVPAAVPTLEGGATSVSGYLFCCTKQMRSRFWNGESNCSDFTFW